MFRLAVARSAARAAATAAPRRAAFSTAGRRVTAALAPASSPSAPLRITSAAASPLRRAAAVRWYSAGGGLEKAEVEGRIISLLQGFDKVNDASNIKGTSHFANDLGLDSLDTVEVVMAIEEEFSIEIPDKDADAIHSVDKAVEYILAQPDAH